MIGKKALPLAIGLITAASTNAATFVMEKNQQTFSIDGNGGAQQGQQIYLWRTNTDNANQQWVQISQGDSYYSYKKQGTNLCWDGGEGGSRRQPVTLEQCDEDNLNQHWKKVKVTSGTEIYRFEKRNAPGWSIDGNRNADYRQAIYLWNSNSNNVNQQWDLLRTDSPEPETEALYLQHADSGLYYETNASGQLVLSASTTSTAQGLEKVENGGGFSLRAVGGDFDGLFAYEPSGSNRQELTADEDSAEIFYEQSCDGNAVYFVSGTTGSSLKNESDDMIGNGSGGDCGSDANEFVWSTGTDFVSPAPTPTPVVTPTPTPSVTPTPTPSSTPAPTPAGDAEYPSDLMRNVDQWKITFPDGEEVKQLADVENEYFYVNDDGNGIVFYAPVRSSNGTTPNSSYIRSELRERTADGGSDIYWTTEGRHVLYVKQAITHLPIVKPHLVATQIHGDKAAGIDDSMVMRLEEDHMFLSFNGGKLREDFTVTTGYELGTIHEVIFEVIDDKHYVYYSEDGNLNRAYQSGNASKYLVKDGSNDFVMDLNYDQSYFKVGNYTQSNAEKEGDYTDHPDNYGEVIVYDFWVEHD